MTMHPSGRRARITALGRTPLETVDHHLLLEPQPRPAASELAREEVLIGVRAATVGWVDLIMGSGQYQHVPEPPYTPGLEFAGEVLEVGAGVSTVSVGDRVIADGLLTGPRSLGSYRSQGGFASYAVAPAKAAIPIPAGLPFEEASCLLGGAETAYHALVHRARLRAGETVLILGATGSVGLAAVQLAKVLGARVLAAGRSPDKLARAQAEGADALLDLRPDAPRLRDQVKGLTEGRGADVVYDPVGGALSTEALRAAAFGARFVVVGWASTPFAGRGDQDPNVLPTNLILMKGIDVLGSPAAIAVHRDPSLRRERLERLLAWAGGGHLRPHVGATYPLDALHEALHAKWEGRHPGNVVVVPGLRRSAP
ncbi:MAG: NADPH:quinone oxidoreductase family protein [Deltaproteobacteria bacterium]|nr:MAG: NADPH:quinone oxidoreductase family protein [Deltaproteobacteria bacterium]